MTIVGGSECFHYGGPQPVDKSLVSRVPKDKDADRSESHVQTNDHVSEKDPIRNEGIVSSTWWLEHNVRIGWVKAEGGSGWTVRDQVDPEKLHGNESLRTSNRRGQKDGNDLSNVGRNHVPNKRLHVGINRASLFDRRNNRSKVIVGQNHIGSLLGHLRSGNSHGNTDRGLFEGGGIVDSVPCHGRNFSARSEDLDQQLLVPWFRSGKDSGATSLHN
mmetsp:Transcript_23970/g.52460  ORF Transcript_23970/g.52460 Transcript_23970/m.52460 type:complete len:217 (-) Transcript_23970:1977-2627(-)